MKKFRKFFSTILIALLLITVLCLVTGLSGCGQKQVGTQYEEVCLDMGDGTYTFASIVVPEGDDVPLVVMSHGIYGGYNSGGAEELADRLAAKGIASIRCDFNRCKSSNPQDFKSKDKGKRVNEYTLTDMMDSNVAAIDYMLENYSMDPDRIGLYGRSFGGRVSMIMGNNSYGDFDYKAMALIAPAGNEYALIHFFGGQEKWDELEKEARQEGGYMKKGLRLTSEWFDDYYKYNPALTGNRFEDKPVMVYYNTLDKVVEPKTSLECASAYSNVKTYEVTTEDGHGYEMAFDHSEIKEEIMNNVCEFFSENL